ncbi:MAG: hypothetical protein ABS41_00765 [Arenimonas sp. SCN 70-307]|uniref:YwqG family protein n=1 Tax=Arenimonas sp. SCN 70-307 TaxID=1660089 RepID=UPI00086E1AE6|nr:DUF1963 domain-containing protein [Arenimonas sp. SCN 70-307]ODS64967.1 MAG: hypothetical protein ABS41_00765 [Arenimonas sp. SCN 70-307]
MKILVVALVLALIVGVIGAWLVRQRAEAQASLPPPVAPLPAGAVREALAPYQDALEATRRPVLRISLEDFPEDAPTASKVGGRAWWPEGEAAPVGEGGAAMVLLAQVNFAEVPATPGYPDTGLLQFFIVPNDFYGASMDRDYTVEALTQQRNFRVVYWADPSAPGQSLDIPSFEDEFYTPHKPQQPRRMRFAADTETLSARDYRIDQMLGGNAWETLENWAKSKGYDDRSVVEVFEHLGGGGHKLGGYPDFTQQDPRKGGPLELLLQLDSDDRMMWGDVGVGGFYIDPADLARKDFSRVMYNWDCH